MPNFVAILALTVIFASKNEAVKCFHNSVPFLTKEAACNTMGPTFSTDCLHNRSPPLFYIPQFLTSQIYAAIQNGNTYLLSSLKQTSATILSQYSNTVMAQELRFLQAAQAAIQTCNNAASANPPTATPMDLIGAQKKLIQAQNNYATAQQSFNQASSVATTLGAPHKKRDLMPGTCDLLSAYPPCFNSDPRSICQCNMWFNCLSKSHRNCYNGIAANSIVTNCVSTTGTGGLTDNTSSSCSFASLSVSC